MSLPAALHKTPSSDLNMPLYEVTLIDVKLIQSLKGPSPSCVTLEGIVTVVKLLHDSKAKLPIDKTEEGIEMLDKEGKPAHA